MYIDAQLFVMLLSVDAITGFWISCQAIPAIICWSCGCHLMLHCHDSMDAAVIQHILPVNWCNWPKIADDAVRKCTGLPFL